MKPKAILFDLDDTILTCEGGDHMKLWRSSVEKHIHRFTGIDAQDFFQEIRSVTDEFWSDPVRHRTGRLNIRTSRQNIVKRAASNLESPNDEASILLADHYHNQREFNVVPFTGALQTLKHFKRHKVQTALITNGSSETQRSKIDKYSLDKYFDMVLIEGEFGRGKPDPFVYTHITDQLGVSPNESCIVGDNLEWEVRVPKTLGFYTIWNDHRCEGLPVNNDVNPDSIVNSIYELIELFP